MATTLSAAAGAPAPVVPAADLAELDAIVTAVLSPLNDVRQAAEDALLNQWRLVPQRVPLLIAGLAELLRSSPVQTTRSMAAVLIRRIGLQAPAKPPNAPVDESLVTVWGLLEQGVRDFVQGCLLQAISQETDQSVRHKICDATALVGVQNSNIGVPWPALLTAVFECVHSPSPQLRDAGLRIISLGAVLFFDLSASAKLVNEIFPANLEFPDSSVKSTAVEACVSFMIAALEERPKAVDQFSGLLQRVLQALVPINDEDVLTNCLSSLTDLASERARIFQKPLLELTQFINSIMKNSELDSTTRQTAAELLVTIANEIPKIVKKKSQFISTLLPTLFDWLATLEDDPDWYTTEDLSQDDEDNGENYVYAEQAIDRLAIALGGETMLPIAFELIPRFIGSADWRQRYAALMAISVLGEGCASLMVERLNDIVKLVLPYLRDSHNRVRYAACNAIGQLCTDFSPTIQNENGQVILASLVPLMDDDSCPRVQAHSAAALVNFLDHADKFKVYPVVGEILPRLVNLLRSNKTYIQEQAVTTIATVADCVQEHFLPYTQSIMPDLVQILQNAMDRKYRLLRGKTLECITLIGLSVKEEGFSPYVEPLLQLLQDIQQSPREDDDPMTSYLLVAWVRMCKIIGAKFVPYLPIVVPPLLAAASVKPEVAIISSEEEFEMYSQEEGWDFIKLGDQRLGIKTALVEDKRTAVEMLCTYAADLEAHFAPYVEKSLAVTLPLVGFVFDLGVRQAAARAAPLLLNCMKQANADMGQILPYWNTVKEKIYERIMMDHDTEYLSDLYISFYLCVRYLGKDFMEADLMEKLVTAAEVNLKQLVSRAYARKANDDEDDLDAEDEELDDENLLIEIANSVHEFFSVGGADFLPYFDKLAPMFKQFLDSKEETAFHFGISVFGDLVDYSGPHAADYEQHFNYFKRFAEGLQHESAQIRQAASYCVGICAKRLPQVFGRHCVQVLPLLGAIIVNSRGKDIDEIMAGESAVSAVGKICNHIGGTEAFATAAGLDVKQTLAHWLDALPLLHDEEEADPTYTYLLSLLESNNPVVLGENNSKLPQVGSVLARALLSDLTFDDELKERMVAAMKTIVSTCQVNPFDWVDTERQPFLQQLLS